jgi:uncharacterized membrane protein YfcA
MEAGFNPLLAFAWSVLCGFIMSMGAGGGGILAGVGHISVLGIADANMIKVVNQILEFSSRLVSVPLYYRQKRLVASLAIAFGVGAPVGAIVGSWVSKHYLDNIATYRVWFGALVTAIALRILYEGWRKPRTAAKLGRQAQAPDLRDGAKTIDWSWLRCRVRYGGETLEFNPLCAALGGFAISFVGALLGVGGGFLVTPFMASMLLFPMYLVIGTGLIALMIPLTVSVLTYLALQVNVNWLLVAVEVPGVLAGSFVGPLANRYMNEKMLKTFVAATLLAIGLYYVVLTK